MSDRISWIQSLMRGKARWSTGLVMQFAQPSLNKPLFRLLLRETQGPLIGHTGILRSSQSPAEIGSRRMSQVIFLQIPARENGVDQGKSDRRTVAHGNGDGTVQLDHR